MAPLAKKVPEPCSTRFKYKLKAINFFNI